jgi:hypothetical protein
MGVGRLKKDSEMRVSRKQDCRGALPDQMIGYKTPTLERPESGRMHSSVDGSDFGG